MRKLYVWLLALFCSLQLQAQTYTLGTGTTDAAVAGITPFGTQNEAGRVQYIYLASELTGAGASAGDYGSIAFDISSLGDVAPANVNIKIGATSASTLAALDTTTSLVTVYSGSPAILSTGWNTFTFSAPLHWNGTSNIMVEVCFTGTTSGTSGYGVNATQFLATARKTFGFYADGVNGCTMTTGSSAGAAARRYRPNLQISKAATAAPSCASGFSIADGASGIARNGTISWAATSGATSYDIYFGTSASPAFVGNQSAVSYAPAVMSANTTYHYKIVPRNLIGAASGCAERTFTTGTALSYCTSTGDAQYGDSVSGVTFANLSNTGTGADVYTDYSGSHSADVVRGVTYSGTAGLAVYVNTAGDYTNAQSVYIDWNQDGDFNDAGESYDLGTATNVTNGLSSAAPLSVTVPQDAALGATRMRVQSKYSSATDDPCLTGFDGEVEDYAINITNPATPSITGLGSASACAGGTITINGSNLLGATASDVTIGGTPVSGIDSNDGSTLVATIGSGTTGTVSVTTPGGTATSATSFTVNPLPVITAQPVVPAAVCGGAGIASVSVLATNAATYQWRRDGVNLSNVAPFSGSDTATLTLTNAAASDSGSYDVVVTSADGCSVTSDVVAVTVNNAPPATTNALICQGGSASLSATANCPTLYSTPVLALPGTWNAATDPVAPRPGASISNTATCSFDSGSTRNYAVKEFQVSVAGNYTFSMTASGSFDGMGYLVSGGFTPGDCNGGGTWIKGDDDSGGGNEPSFTATLQTGVVYTLVSTTYSLGSGTYSGNFNWNITTSTGGQLLLPVTGVVNWYTAASGGSAIGSGDSFNPVGVARSGIPDNNAVGTYTFYAACSTNSECRTAATFTINQNVTYYADSDSDGYGNPAVSQVSCMGAPAGYVLDNTDCNDADGSMHQTFDFYADSDGDSYGAGSLVAVCNAAASPAPVGYSLNSTDCDDTKASVHPNAEEIGYNLIDDDCDGLTDEGFPPKQTAVGLQCNTMLPSVDAYIYAYIVAGAQGYHWRVTTLSGANAGEVQTLDTQIRSMKLIQLPHYAFNATYQVEAAVYYAGYLQPYQPSNCTITTPLATTQLGNCNQQMTNMTDAIYANIVPFASGYRFRITDPLQPTHTQEIDRPIRDVRLSMVSAFPIQYGKAYNIDVAVRNTDGSYMPYGSVCSVTTPTFPTTSLQDSQCDGYVVPNANTQIYANSYPGAIRYIFLISGAGLPADGYTLVKNVRSFTLNEVPGWLPTNVYTVRVRMVFNDSDPVGPMGKSCTITAPGLAKMAGVKTSGFDAIAYPNPFANAFEVKVTTASSSPVQVNVYDMTGRLIETRQAKPDSGMSLGGNYASGVYNVIVNQGDEVTTLRVIKR